jgi:signal transduction histidine kinase
MELEVALPSGRRWWAEASGAPIRDESGEVIGGVAVTVDVTERRRAQDALRDADRRKNEFLAMLAHELRNPLAPICYGAHALSKGVKSPQDTQRLVVMMERQLAHLVRLVDELLDVARISSGRIELKKQRLALADVIGQSIETIENRIQSAGHALILAPSREQLFVDGDCVRLVQVFGNLLANAAKYTDPGGRVELLWAREGNSAVVTVRDNGIGVEPSMLASIFDLFTRVKEDIGEQREGIGVGLALAKRLVELHGGQVEARSAGLGRGAEFIVRLPLAAPASGQEPARDGAAMEAGALRR